MERSEVQGVVDLAIAKYHAENVTRLTRIEDRIIGIDGNGTGKIGALQRLGMQIVEMSVDLKTLLEKRQQEKGADQLEAKWVSRVKTAAGSIAGGVVAIGGMWIKHKMGW